MEWAKVLSFVWEKVLFYREVKLLITFTETFFQASRAIGLPALLYTKSDTENIKNPGKVFSRLTIHRKFS